MAKTKKAISSAAVLKGEKPKAMPFLTLIEKFRAHAYSEKDKGERFERLMQAYLLTDPKCTSIRKIK